MVARSSQTPFGTAWAKVWLKPRMRIPRRMGPGGAGNPGQDLGPVAEAESFRGANEEEMGVVVEDYGEACVFVRCGGGEMQFGGDVAVGLFLRAGQEGRGGAFAEAFGAELEAESVAGGPEPRGWGAQGAPVGGEGGEAVVEGAAKVGVDDGGEDRPAVLPGDRAEEGLPAEVGAGSDGQEHRPPLTVRGLDEVGVAGGARRGRWRAVAPGCRGRPRTAPVTRAARAATRCAPGRSRPRR